MYEFKHNDVLWHTIIQTFLAFSLEENVQVLETLGIMMFNFLIDYQIPNRTLD
jgi:hypothetical protein